MAIAAVGVLVIAELFYLFNCRSLKRNMFSPGLFSNPWLITGGFIMIGLQMFFTYSPLRNTFFKSAPIPWQAWVRVISISGLIYILVEAEKWITNRLMAKKYPPHS